MDWQRSQCAGEDAGAVGRIAGNEAVRFDDEGFRMILIVGTVRLPSERIEVARPIMATMVEASRAEAGCLEYCYAEDLFDPGLIHVKERWVDRKSLEEHFMSPHLADWRANWPSLGISDRNLHLYEVGEPASI